ncbi:Caspase-7 [Sparganum proliferum]
MVEGALTGRATELTLDRNRQDNEPSARWLEALDFKPRVSGIESLVFHTSGWACRGSAFDRGVSLASDAGAEDVLVCKLPSEADILVANSTVPGYFAWRNSNTGSWFIQELCTVLGADAANSGEHFDIVTLLTVVSRKVALLYESNTGQPGSHGMKQMVSVSSTLTRRAFLTG